MTFTLREKEAKNLRQGVQATTNYYATTHVTHLLPPSITIRSPKCHIKGPQHRHTRIAHKPHNALNCNRSKTINVAVNHPLLRNLTTVLGQYKVYVSGVVAAAAAILLFNMATAVVYKKQQAGGDYARC